MKIPYAQTRAIARVQHVLRKAKSPWVSALNGGALFAAFLVRGGFRFVMRAWRNGYACTRALRARVRRGQVEEDFPCRFGFRFATRRIMPAHDDGNT
jgi:hypothetical protein